MTENDIEKKEDTTYDHVIKYTGLFGGIQGLTMLMSIIRTKIVSELLGPSGLAIINLYNKSISFLNQATNFGISFSAVKHVAELFDTGEKEKIERFVVTVRTWSLLTALFGMIICCIFSPLLSLWTFEDYNHILSYCLLSPIVGMLAVSGGELAILKGMKQLKKVSLISAFSAVSILIISAPTYYLLGIKGIILSLILSNAAILLIHLHFSTKVMPWKTYLTSLKAISNGIPMVKLGIGFILAGVLGQGADLVILSSINSFSGEHYVGLYNAGYALAVTYSSIIFVAMDADFFPRLSAAGKNIKRMNHAINQQMEICVLLITPCLILFALAMPFIMRILYAKEFIEAGPMAICASFFMFFKALTLPVAYLPLSKGDSKMYLLTELIYDVYIALCIPFAFKNYGLIGAGWAIGCGGLLDMLLIHLIYRKKYKYKFSTRHIKFYIIQFILFSISVYVSLYTTDIIKWTIGVPSLLLSLIISIRILKKETTIIAVLKTKFINLTKRK